MLTADELTSLRAAVEDLFPDTCTLRRPTNTPDGYGGVTTTYADTTAVPCRLVVQRGSGSRGQVGDQLSVTSIWSLLVAYDQDVAEGDRVITGGITFAVQGVSDIPSERTHRRAELRRAE